jgi:drug/metabolite transporter (DMT)-like permease
MVLSALLIAVADSLIKKESVGGSLLNGIFSPLMIVVYVLYFIQIIIAVYLFKHGGELAIYANLYIIFYSILCVVTGVLIFGEHISQVQGAGILLALVGAFLINFK